MDELYKLKDMLCKELKEYGKKDKLDAPSLEVVDKLSHALKNLCKVIEAYETENGDYGNSYAMMPQMQMPRMSYDNGMSYARGRGRNARRDSMGRYSSRDGSDFRMEFQELMQDAPNDYVRQKMAEVMGSM